MSDVAFDTHAEIRKLEQSGIPLRHAEALVGMVARAPTSTLVMETLEHLKIQVDTNMATKADLASLQNADNAEFAAVAASLDRLDEHVEKHTATKADLAVLRADLYRVLWLQGGALATLIVALAGMILVFAGYTQANT